MSEGVFRFVVQGMDESVTQVQQGLTSMVSSLQTGSAEFGKLNIGGGLVEQLAQSFVEARAQIRQQLAGIEADAKRAITAQAGGSIRAGSLTSTGQTVGARATGVYDDALQRLDKLRVDALAKGIDPAQIQRVIANESVQTEKLVRDVFREVRNGLSKLGQQQQIEGGSLAPQLGKAAFSRAQQAYATDFAVPELTGVQKARAANDARRAEADARRNQPAAAVAAEAPSLRNQVQQLELLNQLRERLLSGKPGQLLPGADEELSRLAIKLRELQQETGNLRDKRGLLFGETPPKAGSVLPESTPEQLRAGQVLSQRAALLAGTPTVSKAKGSFSKQELESAGRALDERTLQAQELAAIGRGGRGGRGGGGGGRGVGSGAPTDPFDAFFGALTHKGFSTNKGFDSSTALTGIAASAGNVVKYGLLYSVLGKVQGAFGATLKSAVDYSDSLTDVEVALGHTGTASQSFVTDLSEVARVAGSNVGAALDAAARGIRAFGDTAQNSVGANEAIGVSFTKIAGQVSVITHQDLTGASKDIVAVGSAYGFQADQLSRVSDAIANAKGLGGDPGQISQGLASFSIVAKEAGFNAEEAANAISVVQARTDQAGSTVATRLSKIVAIIQSSAGQQVLRGIGVSTGPGISVQDQIRETARVLPTLSESQARSVSSKLAGPQGLREFQVLLQNQDVLLEANDKSARNAGAGANEYSRQIANLAGLLRRLKGDISLIQVEVAKSGIGDIFGIALTAADPLLKTVAQLLQMFNSLPHVIRFGIAALGEFYLAGRLVSRLADIGGARAIGTRLIPKALRNAPVASEQVEAVIAANPGSYTASLLAGKSNEEAKFAFAKKARVDAAVIEQQSILASTEAAAVTDEKAAADLRAANRAVERAVGETEVTAALAAQTEAQTAATAATQAHEVVSSRLALAQARVVAAVELDTVAEFENATATEAAALAKIGEAGAAGISRVASVGTSAVAGIGSFLASPAGAVIGVLALVAAINALQDASKRAQEALHAEFEARHSLLNLTTDAGFDDAAKRFQEAAQKERSKSKGISGVLSFLEFGPSKNTAGELNDKAAALRDEKLQRDKARTNAANLNLASAFDDTTSIEGLTLGLDALDKAGASSAEKMKLLAAAISGVAGGPGTILPGGSALLAQKSSSAVTDALGAGLLAASGSDGRRQATLIDQVTKAGGHLGTDDFKIGTDLTDLPSYYKGTNLAKQLGGARKKLDKGQIPTLDADAAGQILATQIIGDDAITDTRKRVQEATSKYLSDHGIDPQKGGTLSKAQLDELAHIQAAQFVADIPGSAEQKKAFADTFYASIRASLDKSTDPSAAKVTQEVSNFLQKTYATAAPGDEAAARTGDAARLAHARNNQNAALDRLAGGGDREGRRFLSNASDDLAAANKEADAASRPATAVEAARARYNDVLQHNNEIRNQGNVITAQYAQEEIDAKRGLVAALEAETQSESDLAIASLGADDAVGRARAKYNETLRQEAAQRQLGNIPEANRLLASAQDQANQESKSRIDRQNALGQLGTDPQNAVSTAQEDLRGIDRQLRNTTVTDPGTGEFTSAYVDLLTKRRAAVLNVLKSITEEGNAARDAAVNPQDELGLANAAVQDAADTLHQGAQSGATYSNNLRAYKQALQSASDTALGIATSMRDALVVPGDALSSASASLDDAKNALAASQVGTSKYYQSVKAVRDAQTALGEAELADSAAARRLQVRPGDTLAADAAELKNLLERKKFHQQNSGRRLDYDAQGRVVGLGPEFDKLGKGIGSEFVDGITAGTKDFDYKQLGLDSSTLLGQGFSSFDFAAAGTAAAQAITDALGLGAQTKLAGSLPSSGPAGVDTNPGVVPNFPAGTDIASRLLRAIGQQESGGSSNYGAKAHGASSASGKYQYTDGTWNGYGGYAHASDAPPDVQERRARQDIEARLKAFNGDIRKVIQSHFLPGSVTNPGKYNPDLPGGGIPGAEKNPTPNQYVAQVLAILAKQSGLPVPVTTAPAARNVPTVPTSKVPKISAGRIGTAQANTDQADINDLAIKTAADTRELNAARAASAAFPGSTLESSKNELDAANAEFKALTPKTLGWYQALAHLHSAQRAYSDAILEAHHQSRLLGIDLTDPVKTAAEEARAATDKVKSLRAAGAPKDVVDAAQNDNRSKANALESAKFSQQLSDVQTNERLGRISHAAYIKYLQTQHDQFALIKHKTRQQIDEANQIDEALQAANKQASGQWNIGDIKIPTPYELKRTQLTQAVGTDYYGADAGGSTLSRLRALGANANGGTVTTNSNNTTVSISGADVALIRNILTQLLGPAITQRSTSTTIARKG